MDTIVIRLNGRESAVLMEAIRDRLRRLESLPMTPEIYNDMQALHVIVDQASPQISQMAAKARADEKHQQN